jgi:hypothetical protein
MVIGYFPNISPFIGAFFISQKLAKKLDKKEYIFYTFILQDYYENILNWAKRYSS